MHLQQATFMPLSCTYIYSYIVITHVHFVDLDILIRLDVDFATLQRFFNFSILARLEDFLTLEF